MPALDETRFRCSPFVELKALADLEADQREHFRELESDPDFFGLFIPKPPLVMNLKSVGRQTAELFQALMTPSRLSEAVLADHEAVAHVADLVLDGILEIESGEGFVHGADALPLVCEPVPAPDTTNAVSRLSRDALLHAEDLETTQIATLTDALYYYNRIPLSPFWRARFPNSGAILAHLGADRGSTQALLEREWRTSRSPGWMSWSPRTRPRLGADGVTYKLYVSPRPERIRDAFEVFVRTLASFGGTPFKMGDRAAGMLRSDKLIAYFTSRDAMNEAAAALGRGLAGCEAQGVPFSASLDESGLLSWGVDPPDNDRALRWLERDSWRLWVAKRLGAALAIAKTSRETSAMEPWRFALERARRHGVDIETWGPSSALWTTP